MKINITKILIALLFLFGANANAQYLGTYMNGISVPGLRLKQVDAYIKSDAENLKNNKIKTVRLYDEKDKLIKEASCYSMGRITQILDYYAYADSVYKKTEYEYNSDGLVTAYKYTLFDNTTSLPPNPTAAYYEYKDGREFRIKEDTLKKDYGIYEAVYLDNKLVGVKVYSNDLSVENKFYPVNNMRNSIAFTDTSGGGVFNFFHITEVKDTIKIISDLMTNEEHIYFNDGRIMYEGTLNNYYRNYFYKENGLVDYVIESDKTIPEKKIFYRYEYY